MAGTCRNMRGLAAVFAVIGAFFLLEGTAFASSDPDFDRWIQALWKNATERPIERGLFVNLKVVNAYVPAEADLNALREQVKLHPQDPRASDLGDYDRVLAGKPYTTVVRLWTRAGEWRASVDSTNTVAGDMYRDDCVRRNFMWSLQRDRLLTIRPDREFPGYFDIRKQATGFAGWLWAFPTGGLSLVDVQKFGQPEVVLAGTTWEATATVAGTTKSIRVRGEWAVAEKRGIVNAVEWNPGDPANAIRFEAADWKANAAFGTAVASTVREFRANGRPDRSLTMLESHEVDSKEMSSVTATPQTKGDDPVRGKSTFTSIYDFTGQEGTVTSLTGGDQPAVVPYNEGHTKAHIDLQQAGWWLAAALVASLSVLAFRKYITKRLKDGATA